MSTQLKRQIREIIQVLNDEALFHAREIPGDQDVFEPRGGQNVQDTGMTKYGIYESIQSLIDLYDRIEESELTNEAASIISHIKDDIVKLQKCAGKSYKM